MLYRYPNNRKKQRMKLLKETEDMIIIQGQTFRLYRIFIQGRAALRSRQRARQAR